MQSSSAGCQQWYAAQRDALSAAPDAPLLAPRRPNFVWHDHQPGDRLAVLHRLCALARQVSSAHGTAAGAGALLWQAAQALLGCARCWPSVSTKPSSTCNHCCPAQVHHLLQPPAAARGAARAAPAADGCLWPAPAVELAGTRAYSPGQAPAGVGRAGRFGGCWAIWMRQQHVGACSLS